MKHCAYCGTPMPFKPTKMTDHQRRGWAKKLYCHWRCRSRCAAARRRAKLRGD